MKILHIILDDHHPVIFVKDSAELDFHYKNDFFEKTIDWVGGHYSFLIYVENNHYFLSEIESDFPPRFDNLTKVMEGLKYIKILKKDKDYVFYNLNLFTTPKDSLLSLPKYSMYFGDDELYYSKRSNTFCLAFILPDEIQIKIE
jgi:hypothetical protein